MVSVGSFRWKICATNGSLKKKSRFHGRNVPNGNSCSISSKPFLIRVSAFRDPFFGKCNWLQQMVNAILEGKLPVLNSAYHNLPKPWTNRFAHEIGTNHSSTHVPQGWLRVTERDQAIFGQMAQVAQVLFGFGWPRRVSALLSFLKVLLHSYLTILWVSLFEKKKEKKRAVSVFRFAVSWFSIYCLWKTQVDQPKHWLISDINHVVY